MNPLERRVRALRDLLALDKPTTKSIPYSQWPVPPQLVVETNRGLFLRFGMVIGAILEEPTKTDENMGSLATSFGCGGKGDMGSNKSS